MTETDAESGRVTGSAAQVYDAFFVPALFAQWCDRVLDAAGVAAGHDVLDVGCGTGVLTLAAALRVGPAGSATGLDRNAGMLAVAGRRRGATWREGDAEALPFPDGSFDRVVSQFVAMFLERPRVAAAETTRVLRPGGRFAVATWAGLDHSPGYADLVRLLADVLGPEAADALRVPFRLGTKEALAAAVGPDLPGLRIGHLDGTARFPSLEAWLHTEIRGWTLSGLAEGAFDELLAAAGGRLAHHVRPDGTVTFAVRALVATACRRG